MITSKPSTRHPERAHWQRQIAEAVTDADALLRHLGIDPGALPAELRPATGVAFPLRVPWSYVHRMRHGDPADPLLRQVLPVARELQPADGFVADPLGEAGARRAPALLQKYRGRALLVSTEACAVHCRYCFRREYDYAADVDHGQARWESALDAFAADPGLDELILSGGDPLSLSNTRLSGLLARIDALPQVRRIRVHTRTPVVLPDRVDAGLLDALRARRARIVVVVHANHARELDDDVRQALRALAGTGALVLNQSVLLAGVNDDEAVLEELSRALFDAGVLPYYLHLLDRVTGVSHFEVPEARAVALLAGLNARLPGYLVPRLVREEAGRPGKTPLGLRESLAD